MEGEEGVEDDEDGEMDEELDEEDEDLDDIEPKGKKVKYVHSIIRFASLTERC